MLYPSRGCRSVREPDARGSPARRDESGDGKRSWGRSEAPHESTGADNGYPHAPQASGRARLVIPEVPRRSLRRSRTWYGGRASIAGPWFQPSEARCAAADLAPRNPPHHTFGHRASQAPRPASPMEVRQRIPALDTGRRHADNAESSDEAVSAGGRRLPPGVRKADKRWEKGRG